MTSTPASAPVVFSPAQVRAIIVGLLLVMLLGAMDQTIVSVALPQMSADLQGFGLLAWVASGYLISAAVAMPIYGKLGDLYGRRATLSFAIGLFLVASVFCALAQSMDMLVAARIFQGIGGGGLISVAQAIVADVVSPRERGRYQGYFSTTFAVASVAGPLVGGLLTHYMNWRWVFWVNLPLALAALVISRRSLVLLPVPHIRRSIDVAGALLLVAALTSMLVAITRAGQGMAWLGAQNAVLFGLAFFLLVAFVWQELRAAEPLIPLRLFQIHTVLICCPVAFIGFFQIVSLSVLVPLQMQMLAGAGPREAAVGLVPLTLATPLGAYVGGKFTARTGKFKPLILVSNGVAFVAMLAFAFTDAHAGLQSAALLALTGFGMGLQFPATMVGVQNAVSRSDIGVATATIAFVRSFGAAIGVAVLTSILLSTLRSNAPALASSMTGAEIMHGLIGGAFANVDAHTRQQLATGTVAAFRQIFLVGSGLALVSLGFGSLLRNETLRDRIAPEK